MDATQEGADIHEKLVAKLTPKPDLPVKDDNKQVEDAGGEPPVAEEPAAQEHPDDGEAAEGPQFTLSDFAAAFGIEETLLDLNDDGEVIFKAKIDNEEKYAKASDLLKSYQLEGHLNKQNMDVVELRKSLEAERTQYTQQATQRLQQLEDTLALTSAQFNSEFQSVDWNRLKQENPQEYTRLRIEFGDKQSQLQNSYSQLNTAREHQKAEILNTEKRMLLDKIPEWKDESKFQAGAAEIINGAKHYGFTAQEVTSALDHRILLMARDAIAYRKLQDKKPEVTQKVRTAPKIVKPGVVKPTASKDEALKKLKARIQKGEDGALSAYLMQSGIASIKR